MEIQFHRNRSIGLIFYKMRIGFVALTALILSKLFFVELSPMVSVAAFIEDKDGKMLFLDLSYKNGFCLPGGIIHSGENIEDALRREVFEETGLIVVRYEYWGSSTSSIFGISTMSLIFWVEASGELRESKEGKLYWLDPQTVINRMAYENNEIAIRNYLESCGM